MDYKEKYNKLVEAVKVLQETNPSDEGIQNWVKDNVPELRESEDERIKKCLITIIKIQKEGSFGLECNHGASWNEMLAWLEKQGDNNAKWSDKEELHIKQLESIVKKVWAIAEHEDDKDTIREMSDLSFFLKTLNPEKKGEKSHAWSEEDERIYQSIIDDAVQENLLYNEQINWLKSIKQRIS